MGLAWQQGHWPPVGRTVAQPATVAERFCSPSVAASDEGALRRRREWIADSEDVVLRTSLAVPVAYFRATASTRVLVARRPVTTHPELGQ